MQGSVIRIEGSEIRAELRRRGLPGGGERVCCGGRKNFSRDYETQLKKLGKHGTFKILENGVLMDTVTV